MRIAFVSDHRNEHTRRWVEFFAERGHEVHVVTCGDSASSSTMRYVVHDLGRPRLGKFGYLLKVRRARRVIRALAPDVVHAHHATSYGLFGAVSNIHPFVVTCHGSDVLLSPRNPIMRELVRRVLRRAALITVPAEHVREAAARLAGPDAAIAVFQYGVETDRLAVLAAAERERADKRAPDDEVPVRIVTARPLTALYRTSEVVRAVAELRAGGHRFTYDLLGRGPERQRLESLVGQLGIADSVIFHGHVTGDEVERVLARADCYISVADSDGASIALLEAMALGAIPIVSDIEANRTWITEGVNGCVVATEPRAIAAGVHRALRLDRATIVDANSRLVRESADRATNLGACEALFYELLRHHADA